MQTDTIVKPAAAGDVPNPANSPAQVKAEQTAKRARTPLSVPRTKMSVPDIPGYHCHWFNDLQGRIAQALQGGYQFVESSEVALNSFSFGTVNTETGNTDLGTRVSLVVGDIGEGRPLRAYLMKIPQELFQEDQGEIQKISDNIDQQIHRGTVGAEGGGDFSNRYVKQSSIHSTRPTPRA